MRAFACPLREPASHEQAAPERPRRCLHDMLIPTGRPRLHTPPPLTCPAAQTLAEVDLQASKTAVWYISWADVQPHLDMERSKLGADGTYWLMTLFVSWIGLGWWAGVCMRRRGAGGGARHRAAVPSR